MSLYSVGDTGNVPPPPSGTNEFQNVNVSNDNNSSSNSSSNNAPANNAGIDDGETLATAESTDIATAEPVVTTAPVTMAKSGKPLSAAQANVQRLRSETLADMRKKYAERFGDSSVYPKPPKAKAYHASGLTTIRQRDGEVTYNAALKDIMDKNDPLLGKNGKSQLTLTRKLRKPLSNVTVNATRNSSLRMNVPAMNNTAANRGATNSMIASVKEMGATAKQLIDAMINTNNLMVQHLSKSGNTMALTQLSNTVANMSAKAKKPRSRVSTKKAAPLFTVPEETSANVVNATA
jgi:hypothetical protein